MPELSRYNDDLVPSVHRAIHVGPLLQSIALSTARRTSGGAF